MLCAIIAGWHNGPSAKFTRNRLYTEFLDANDWDMARKLALILGLAECLDSTQMQLISNVEASVQDKKARLMLITEDEANIERKAIEKHRKWFKKEFSMDLAIN